MNKVINSQSTNIYIPSLVRMYLDSDRPTPLHAALTHIRPLSPSSLSLIISFFLQSFSLSLRGRNSETIMCDLQFVQRNAINQAGSAMGQHD